MKRKNKKKGGELPPGLLNILKPLPFGRRRPGTTPPPKAAAMQLPMAPPLAAFYRSEGRSCGGCTACCDVIGVVEYGKPYYVRCVHQTDTGCGCYGSRPRECQEYVCAYLAGELPPDESWRPDQLGVIANIELDRSMVELNGPGSVGIDWWLTLYETREGGAGQITGDTMVPKPEVVDLIVNLLRMSRGTAGGIRFIPWGSRVGTQYAIRPPYIDEGDSEGGRLFEGPQTNGPGEIRLVRLNAPRRLHMLPMVSPAGQ